MKTFLSSAPWMGALAAVGAMLGSHTAHAQSCEGDADCAAGFECKTESSQSCSGSYTCNDEGECTYESSCEPYEYSYCANAVCAADSDCPDSMGCFQQTVWECDGGGAGASGTSGTSDAGGAGGTAGMVAAGAGGEAGFGTGGSPCHEVPAESVCIPRYQMPCDTATDCGGGFDCVESYYWTCSGGGGASGGVAGTGAVGGQGGVGGVAGMSDEGSCEQIPSGENSCVLQDLPCASASDCPSGLECSEQYFYPPCSGGAGGAGGTAGTAGMHAGGSISCPEPVLQLRCTPPTYGGGGGMAGTSGGGTSGGGTSGVGGDGPTDPGEGGMAGVSGEGGAAGTGMGSAGAGGATDEDGEHDENSGHHGRGRGLLKRLLKGCSAGGPVGESGSAGWLVLGLAAFVVQRRALAKRRRNG